MVISKVRGLFKKKEVKMAKNKGWEYYLAIILSIVGVIAILLIVLRVLGVL